MNKTALVVGCSYANGYGFPQGKDLPELWTNRICKKLGINDIENCAKSGANNHWIFLETSNMIRQKNYDVVIVAWSETARFNFSFGLETYSTNSNLTDDFNINLVNHQLVSANYQQKTGDRLRRYLNYHWPMLDLVKYVNTLLALKPKNLFFVNSLGGMVRWFFFKKIFVTT